MEVTITKCDICGKKAETDDYNEPTGWYNLHRQGDRDKDFWARRRDICCECGEDIGLSKAMVDGTLRKNKQANIT